jgi:hypothetical protein
MEGGTRTKEGEGREEEGGEAGGSREGGTISIWILFI